MRYMNFRAAAAVSLAINFTMLDSSAHAAVEALDATNKQTPRAVLMVEQALADRENAATEDAQERLVGAFRAYGADVLNFCQKQGVEKAGQRRACVEMSNWLAGRGLFLPAGAAAQPKVFRQLSRQP